MRTERRPTRTRAARWHRLPVAVRLVIGALGSATTLVLIWQALLRPMKWPPLSLVGHYFLETVAGRDTYYSFAMTGLRAVLAMVIGFGIAVALAVLTGRTIVGWISLFLLLLVLQKVPAIAMVHVFVKSSLGIGFPMTIALASTVVLTFTWIVLHHRLRTIDPREAFALRVVGFRGWKVALYGLLPHMGSAIGGSARLAMSIAVVMVVLGEWQGVWSDGTIWQFGLGVQISRSYDAINSEARVLAWCLWLGALGAVLDGCVQGSLLLARRLTGVEFRR